ncbi:MAG: glycosyltransferase family 4 protein [Acidobacteria bacterium]|nr:glycosyltransferase family 4 protein [Acidobacteriota bacterium]
MPDKVVLVHDWLTGMRGGEKVLESLCRLYPDADLLTLVHVPGSVTPVIEHRKVRSSLINRLPAPARWYRHYLPLFPFAIEQFDLDDATLVVSTSHCAAKAVVPTGRAVHVSYSHSPMRYAWDQFPSYFGPDRFGHLGSAAARHVVSWLARWDRDTAPRVNRFIANSAYVARRIRRYYNRQAAVLHPPVDTGFFTPGHGAAGDYFLVVSALVPYKRIDTAIRAAAILGARLKLVGTGPDEERLRAVSAAGMEFLGHVGDNELRALYRDARALVLPGEEDFGIAPVEAQACGRPVVALARGGACETVEHGISGWLVEPGDGDAPDDASRFAEAMRQVEDLPLSPAELHARAGAFSADHFDAGVTHLVAEALEHPHAW